MQNSPQVHLNTRFRSALKATGAVCIAALLSACSHLLPLSNEAGKPSHGWWLELEGPQRLPIEGENTLEIPHTIYRAQFADKEGVYFKSTMGLVYHTQNWLSHEVEGGLYVRYDRPDVATTWKYSLLGAPATVATQPVPVKLHAPR